MGWNFIAPRWPSCSSNHPESVTCECEETGERVRYVSERTCRRVQAEHAAMNEEGEEYTVTLDECSECGGWIAPLAKYCHNCGAKVVD